MEKIMQETNSTARHARLLEYHVVQGSDTIRPTQHGYRETSHTSYHPISLLDTWPL